MPEDQEPAGTMEDKNAEVRTALVYDFDGTLARGNVQEHTFLPELGIAKDDFWKEVRDRTREHDADEILTYMDYMLEVAFGNGTPITRTMLKKHGCETPLFAGLDSWFERINAFGKARGLAVEHYIISSGNLEMIESSSIADQFTKIYASKFIFDEKGSAVRAGVAINYTTKTQFLFRINKGIDNTWDNVAINRWTPMDERPVPFTRMIFFGDGDTDIPSMKMVRHQGGYAIAVFDPEDFDSARPQEKIYRLISEDRVHYVAPADYRKGSQLDVITRGLLGKMARDIGYRE
ncbi:MAG: haloacid dehalogenase-like hydrolase [Nitrospira sp.]|nr:haloacid dehalogenase-like hydrolase [Nitrospira sp.]